MRGTHEVHTAVPRRNNYAVQPASVRSTAPVPKWSGAERRAAPRPERNPRASTSCLWSLPL